MQIQIQTINCYQNFLDNLERVGMTLTGMNGEGVFTLCDYFNTNILWHTMDANTDPWEWRSSILNERKDISYSKIFFGKSGYITSEWYPYFYVIRNGGRTLNDEYKEGKISYLGKKIYEYVVKEGVGPLHCIKDYCNILPKDKNRFESAIIELQMKMYISVCGQSRKKNKYGDEYGWQSMSYGIVDDLFKDVIKEANKYTVEKAYDVIEKQIYLLNPYADSGKVRKFILGK